MVGLALSPSPPLQSPGPAPHIKCKYDKIECAAFLFAGNYGGCEPSDVGEPVEGAVEVRLGASLRMCMLTDWRRGMRSEGGAAMVVY